MMKRLVVLSLLLTGCGLYWGNNNGEDDVCAVAAPDVQSQNRDPFDGQCITTDGGGGGGCGCLPCPPPPGGMGSLAWASCSGVCDNLGESDCLATASCHAEYTAPADTTQQNTSPAQFTACWDTISSYVSTGACAGLDAQTCATHDNCASLMTNTNDGEGDLEFTSCIEESSVCGTLTCGTGTHCAEECPPCNSEGCTCTPRCIPDATCADIDCLPGTVCQIQCPDLVGNDTGGSCAPTCVPSGHDPGGCTGTITCNSAPPACPSNTTAGIENGCYTGYCIPSGNCGQPDPGLCYAQVTCDLAAPACPTGSMPGVSSGGCYTGYCIPQSDCEVEACERLTTEAACTGRADCSPLYTGTDCTCDSSGCTCETLTFERCETTPIMGGF